MMCFVMMMMMMSDVPILHIGDLDFLEKRRRTREAEIHVRIILSFYHTTQNKNFFMSVCV